MTSSFDIRIPVLLLTICILIPQTLQTPQYVQESRSNFTYEYRLIDGETPYEGRLEIRRNRGAWGTIYGFLWNGKHSNLACRSLGFSTALSASSHARYGSSSGHVHFYVEGDCPENATSILDCSRSPWNDHAYANVHRSDVGLSCLPANSSLMFRIVSKDGQNSSGTIEVFDGISQWLQICTDIKWWSHNQLPHLICEQCGYSIALDALQQPVISHTTIGSYGFRCRYMLEDCQPITTMNLHCKHIAGVTCFQEPVQYLDKPYKLRISGLYSGILEASPLGNNDWKQLCFPRTIFDLKFDQVVGNSLCPGSNGRFGVQRVDECSLIASVNISYVTLPHSERSEMKPFGDLLLLEDRCGYIGYHPIIISCIRDIVLGDISVRYYKDFSCSDRCGFDITALYCHCDSDCEMFKDCCYDYYDVCHTSDSLVSSVSFELFACLPFDYSFDGEIMNFLLISKCPMSWTNVDIRFLCEAFVSDDYIQDYGLYSRSRLRTPVYDDEGNNYANIFCAICNNKQWKIFAWNVIFEVEHIGQLNTKRHQCDNADIAIGVDNRVGKRLRHCVRSLIDSCPDISSNMSSMCESYNAIMCPNPNVYAKNAHCAICNGLLLSSDVTRPCFYRGIVNYDTPLFHSIFRFREFAGDDFGIAYQTCNASGEIFDPFSRMCRSLSCSPGYIYDDSLKLCMMLPSIPNAIHGMCCTQQQTWIGYVTEWNSKSNVPENNDCVLDFLNMHSGRNDSTWEHSRITKSNTIQETLSNRNSICNIAGNLNRVILNSDYLVRKCGTDALDYVHICGKHMLQDECNGQWFKDNASEFHLVNQIDITAEIYRYKEVFILPSFVIDYISYNFDYKYQTFSKMEMVLVCGDVIKPLNCSPLVTLSRSDYKVSELNISWILVLSGNFTLKQGEFIQHQDGRIQICASNFEKRVTQAFDYFGVLDVVNVIGNVLSLIIFVILFVIHLWFKILRKHCQGKYIMSLTVSLFCAYLLPILTNKLRISGNLCYALAIFTHFSWLSVFSWFTIISLSMTHTFVVCPTETQESREQRVLYRFIFPIAGFAIPLFVVILCILADIIVADFGYGVEVPCWIVGFPSLANLFAFGIPVAFSLICNTLSFIVTTIFVWRGERQRRNLLRNDAVISWSDVVIAFRMSILMGVGWTMAFVASFSESIIAWWVFICITSFYGIFLLISIRSAVKRKIQQMPE